MVRRIVEWARVHRRRDHERSAHIVGPRTPDQLKQGQLPTIPPFIEGGLGPKFKIVLAG